ncbi:MAG: esterase-like activity of phytase family protein, partial [Chitinophagaceae bacterium]
IRILRYDDFRKPPVQYAYQIDPVVSQPDTPGHFIVNGVSDILAVNDHELLVTERSFSSGQQNSNIRVYLAEIKGAENIASNPSLLQKPPANPIRKRLLLNMDTMGIFINNVEGASFGPLLPNGKRSLIFVADDNFSPNEKNQFLLFEID